MTDNQRLALAIFCGAPALACVLWLLWEWLWVIDWTPGEDS